MDDTPQYIKDKQREIWLAKSPEERLRQQLIDNDVLFSFWNSAKLKRLSDSSNSDSQIDKH